MQTVQTHTEWMVAAAVAGAGDNNRQLVQVGDGGKQKEELEMNNVDINTDRATIMEMGYSSKKNDLVAQIHKIGYFA